MNNLRHTIRKILLENIAGYDKLVTLLCSENIDSINQALELAEALDLVSEMTYSLKSRGDVHKHVWEFKPVEEFYNEIEAHWSIENYNRPNPLHSIFPVGNSGKVKILLAKRSRR